MFNFYKTNKILKFSIAILIIFICITSMLNVVMASDINHTLNCHDDHCFHCEIIHFCQTQILNTIAIISMVAVIINLIGNYKILNLIKRVINLNTLIICKTQLNN